MAQAQFNLAIMHRDGEGGLAIDRAEGARLYALAATQGLANAQLNLGCCYRDGEVVPCDLVEAARLFGLAAEKGDATAQSALSLFVQ